VFDTISERSDCLFPSCNKSLERVSRSSRSFQQIILEGSKITIEAHLQDMILDDHEADQVCLA